MSKLLFFIISVLMISVVQARPRVLSHEQFAYSSPAEQNEMVVKLMELAVELESKYEKEVRTAGYSQERFERYTKLMKQLSDFIMNPAYAADSQEYMSWKKHAENFVSLMGRGNRCVYAGWPSITRMSTVPKAGGGSERKNVCIHPKFIGGNPVSAETRAYQDANSCGTINQITCNPAIFGYKKASAKSVFCVKAGLNDSENSSLLCMREALSDKEDSTTDSKDKRLQFLRESLAKTPTAFQGVQQFVYKSCVCDNFSSNIQRDYLSYMRPHRTCYGMMQMIGETALCENPEAIGIDTSFFQKLNEYTTSESLKSSNASSVDSSYQTFLNSVKGSAEYNNLCGGNGIVVKPDDNNPGGSTTGGGNGENPEDGPEIVVTAQPPTYACKATCPTTSASPERSPGNTDAANDNPPAGQKCEFSFTQTSRGETKEIKATNDITTLPEQGATSFTVKVKFEGQSSEKDVSCTLENKQEDATTPEGLTLKVSKGATTDTTQEVKAEVSDNELKGDYKITWYRKGDAGRPERPVATPRRLAGDEPSTEEGTESRPPRGEGPPRGGSEQIITEASDKDSITETRKEKSYETCADLVSETKPKITGGCVEIAKTEAAAPKPNKPAFVPGANGQAVQPQIPRGSSSTSAGGIR